jgi:predicted TIM-barrel fold metal-dependent hydrolase
MRDSWKYSGPFFDAHTHIDKIKNISNMIDFEDDFGVSKQIGIVHNEEGFKAARKLYNQRFIFAKYLSLRDIAHYKVESVIDEISKLLDQGYSIAKLWFGPRWRDYYDVPKDFQINNNKLEPIFQILEDLGIPLIIHVGDPDTYYESRYEDSNKYGRKDEHLKQLEDILSRYPKIKFQIPHFGSQPEVHRLPDLTRWMEMFPNIVIDTSSSRWMARELSKDTNKAREFMLRFSDRVLFGTDLFANKGEYDYYSGRYVAQRTLWETNEQETPLPFTDSDTVNIGGTVINGLDLPLYVLKRLYWENAIRIYGQYLY